MARNLLELIQTACAEVGLSKPSQVVGSTDNKDQQLLALANREGTEFSQMANGFGGWRALHTEYTFTTVSSQADYTLPSDLKYFVYKSYWDGAQKWELLGPISAQEKQLLRYGIVANGPRKKFYLIGNKMYLNPAPDTGGQVIAYDYFTKNWCQSAAGDGQELFAADTDTYKLDEDCFIFGLKWRFLRAKGLDYGQEYQDWVDAKNLIMARDCGSRDLSLSSGDFGARFLNEDNIPETGYGA